jgi:DNA polymerase-4
MPLRYLFVDMDSFFASVEQQEEPSLRGRPVGVVPVLADGTCCIAASKEAKTFGVKTGTPVWEARRLCPHIAFRVARHERYVIVHNRVVAAVGRCVPVGQIMSIDEMSCPLLGAERYRENAVAIARRIKEEVRREFDYLTCSVGAGPNVMLAKVGADMGKPDGLTVIDPRDLPGQLRPLKLTDFPGVGPRMERRLKLHGIITVEQFCTAPAKTLALVWGSKLLGEKWARLLAGDDVPERPTRRQTVGHSHILPPDLRTDEGAYGVLVKMTHKAAARLRKMDYWAGAVSVGMLFKDGPRERVGWNGYGGESGWDAGCRVPRCQDTPAILRAVAVLWAGRPTGRVPLKVGVVLSDLVPARSATQSLFEADRRAAELSHAMDDVNREFGASVVHLGSMFGMKDVAPTRIAFTQIPDFDRTVS